MQRGLVLTNDQAALLKNYVSAARHGLRLSRTLDSILEKIFEFIFPASLRTFVADATQVIFSPHRELHLLPYHAARLSDRYLIELAAVRYVPNLASLLVDWRGVRDGLVIALGVNEFSDPQLPPSADAEGEARAVAEIWRANGKDAVSVTGELATLEQFGAQQLSISRCLHLATHGSSVFSDEAADDPLASRLYLRDGALDALRIGLLPLRAELVVLSACHSGQRALSLPGSKELPGDDIFGLQAAFFLAGVQSVIGALWPLHDESGARIFPALHSYLREAWQLKSLCRERCATISMHLTRGRMSSTGPRCL